MAQIGAGAQIYLDGVPIHQDQAKAMVTFSQEEVDHTRLGQIGAPWKSHLVTLNDGKVSLNGDCPSVDIDAINRLENLINLRTLHTLALCPFGAGFNYLSIIANVRATKPAEISIPVNGIVSLDTDFITSAASPGMVCGRVGWTPVGNGSATSTSGLNLVYTSVDANQRFCFVVDGGAVSAPFTAATSNSSLVTLLEALLGGTITVTGTLSTSGSSPHVLYSGSLAISFGGSLAGTPIEPPEIRSGAVQSFTIAGGDAGEYTIDGSGNFTLGASSSTVQGLLQALAGIYANATVVGSSAAPVSPQQSVEFTNVPSPVWAAVQGTGNAALSDVADPTSNADWISAIEACAAYSGQTVTASGGITLSGGLLNGTITFTFSSYPAPLLKVVTGVIDNVTASAAISIDGVTVTPGDSISTIQANLRAAGGSDAEVYVTGTSAAGSGGSVVMTSEFHGYDAFTYAGSLNGQFYFVQSGGSMGGWWGPAGYLYWSPPDEQWVVSGTLGDTIAESVTTYGRAYSLPPAVADTPNPAADFPTGNAAYWTDHGGNDIGGAGDTGSYTPPAGASLNLNLLYPTAAGAVSPTVTVGVLTQTAAKGTVLANSTIATVAAGSAGSGLYNAYFPPASGNVPAAATGTRATAAGTTTGGSVATGIVDASAVEGHTYTNANVISGTGSSSDLADIPSSTTTSNGAMLQQQVLFVSAGGSLTQAVDHAPDVDGSPGTYVALGTFPSATQPGTASIYIPPGTTIYPHVRVNQTAVTGTAISHVTFARL